MELKELNESRVCEILNEIIEYEMAGVVRYAHSSLMVTGPYRIPHCKYPARTGKRKFSTCPYRLEN